MELFKYAGSELRRLKDVGQAIEPALLREACERKKSHVSYFLYELDDMKTVIGRIQPLSLAQGCHSGNPGDPQPGSVRSGSLNSVVRSGFATPHH